MGAKHPADLHIGGIPGHAGNVRLSSNELLCSGFVRKTTAADAVANIPMEYATAQGRFMLICFFFFLELWFRGNPLRLRFFGIGRWAFAPCIWRFRPIALSLHRFPRTFPD